LLVLVLLPVLLAAFVAHGSNASQAEPAALFRDAQTRVFARRERRSSVL
jgi:hypothetical protein